MLLLTPLTFSSRRLRYAFLDAARDDISDIRRLRCRHGILRDDTICFITLYAATATLSLRLATILRRFSPMIFRYASQPAPFRLRHIALL